MKVNLSKSEMLSKLMSEMIRFLLMICRSKVISTKVVGMVSSEVKASCLGFNFSNPQNAKN